MSPNEETQNQDAGSPSPSQEPAPEPQAPSSQKVHKAAPEPQASRLDATGKASPSLLRRCWGQLRAGLSIICWEATNILEYLFGVLAEAPVSIILGLLCFFLYRPIEQLAVKLLVAPLLAHFDTGVVPSYTMLVLALCFAFYAVPLCRRRYVIGGKWVLTALMVLLGYYYYRCTPQGLQAIAPFRFTLLFDGAWPAYLASRVTILQPQRWAFADIIPFTCILLLLVWGCRYRCLVIKRLAQIRRCSWTSIRDGITSWVEKLKKRYAPFIPRQERKQAQKVEGFLTDHPLTEEEEALSGWTSQAQALTQKLLATDTTHAAFSLGIIASWGEGKSSFMGIMQRYLQQAQREVIVMRFNPWLYDKEAQLTKVFFEELRRTLAPYSSKLSKSIDNYADLLLAVDSSWLKLAHQLLRLSQRSTAEQFNKLSRDIEELGRKVVIFIDDVDRLTREELMELFNLVRNSSNLPCLYFVLAYDKSYVLKTLQSEGEHMTRYPEKILQEEYPLPKLTPDKMWTVLERCLNKTQLGQEGGDTTSKLLDKLKGAGVNLPYHLTTIRMVKRMANAFNSRYELLHKVGVVPFDLFIFELIYYVYPSVYDYLVEMHKSEHQGDSTPLFYTMNPDKSFQRISLEPGFKHISYDVDNIVIDRGAPSKQQNTKSPKIDSAKNYLEELDFGLKDQYMKNIVRHRVSALLRLLWGEGQKTSIYKINNKMHWGRYFYRGLQKGALSQEELASFLGEPDQSKREDSLKGWSQEKPLAFIEEILNCVPKDPTEMEPIVCSMFDWNALPENEMPFHCSVIDGFIEKGSIPREEKEAMLRGILKDKAAIRPAFGYTVERLHSEGEEATILPEDVVLEIQSMIFEKVVKEVSKEESPIKSLYATYWLWGGSHRDSRVTRHSKINECMRAIIRDKGVDDFLGYILTQAEDKVYFLHDIPWDTLAEFDKFLREQPSTMYIDNFLDFLEIALKQEKERPQKGSIYTIDPRVWKPYADPKFAFHIFGHHYNYLFSDPSEEEQD
ncbi:P-loop NTPase fold protein [Porphyromonas sp.]